MTITLELETLWNLCYHSYIRGARVQQNKAFKGGEFNEDYLGEVNQENFDEFFFKDITKNSLYNHMKELEKEGKLKT